MLKGMMGAVLISLVWFAGFNAGIDKSIDIVFKDYTCQKLAEGK
jgi:hypothetical protein